MDRLAWRVAALLLGLLVEVGPGREGKRERRRASAGALGAEGREPEARRCAGLWALLTRAPEPFPLF